MMRILSWSSGLGSDKTQPSDFNMFVPDQQVSSVVNPLPVSVKRKRSPSLDDQTARSVDESVSHDFHSRQVPQQGTVDGSQTAGLKQEFPTPFTLPSPPYTAASEIQSPLTKPATTTPTDAQLQMMRQTISSQLSLEILLKHKELRLIDQEMAKCQVALEQLRRCNEIPYPATQQPSVSVSAGRGPAVRRASERYPAESPAPWGVIEGPYTRHYSKWLLSDRRFDGGEPEVVYPQTNVQTSASGRSTRGHVVDLGLTSSKARSQRSDFKALPAGYSHPKEKATGPMILKRKSDNTMVKLVCPDCGRHDFGSAQGFINHCRIGHGRSFASHDAAAEACGEPVQYNDNGTIKGTEAVVTPSNTNVHPLVRSAKFVTPSTASGSGHLTQGTARSEKSAPRPPHQAVSPDFHASTQTPHLSALIKNQGLGLDLHTLVTDAKRKVDTPESEDDYEEVDVDSPVPTNSGRHPQVAGSKQPSKSTLVHSTSPLLHSRLPSSGSARHMTQPMPTQTVVLPSNDRRDSFANLLPSPTNESTQAPSLVDDDEEFDAQSPMSTDDVDEDDTPEVDFVVHDDEHADRVPSLQAGELGTAPSTCSVAARPNVRQRPVAARALGGNGHVGFGSPSPAPEGSDRKRRKVGGK